MDAENTTENQAISPTGARVLVIDDNPNNLRMISDFLEDQAFNLLVAEDGESGLARAQYVLPDIILLDILMPGMDGFETCRKLKAVESTREIPVIFMTALSETEQKVKAFQSGAVDYITKPFRKEEVLARLRVHLQLRELTAGLRDAKTSLERKVAERTAQLAEANQRLDKIINTLADPIFVKDSRHRWVLINDALCQLTGFPRETLIGKSDYDFFPKKEADEFWAKDEIVLTTGRENTNEEQISDAHGNVRTIITKKTRYLDDKGNPFIVGIIRDLTEHKAMEEQLRQTSKMEAIGTLAGGVAHDFNNLMMAVIGYSELVLEDLPPSSPLHEDIAQIKKAGDNAAALTRQLLAFSRKQVIQPRVVDLNAELSQTEKMLGRIIGEDIELKFHCAPDLWRITSDPVLVEQVVMNLSINARDAMPEGGTLMIETANVFLDETYAGHHAEVTPGHYVMLTISDTGVGMDADTRAHIFEPFFTTKVKGKGTGLGLATVYGIVKQSGGHIWVYSEKACGTTFKIYLPRSEVHEQSQAAPQDTESIRGGAETILVVEDDENVRSLIAKILKPYGYEVLEAPGGSHALALLDQRSIDLDLLITDVVMPEMGGRQVADAVVARYPSGIEVLFMSGYTDNAIVHHGVLDAGTHFLQKPFSPKGLAKKVRQVLDGKERRG